MSRDSAKLTYISTNPTSGWDPEATIYFSQNDYWRDNYSASRTNGNMILNEDLYGGKLQNTFALGVGKITAGVDFGRHDYHTDNYGVNDRQYRNFSTTQMGPLFKGALNLKTGSTCQRVPAMTGIALPIGMATAFPIAGRAITRLWRIGSMRT